ncbi:hypothetical protein OI18_10825 [Flavihumibacter solisilvae]|uniref:histidine kinase n=2 Tax=Flavihumibacter solisilvae TaxID=1349421 RepID=A0A0C1IK87_9BACT|nr:hypothetical protein OI18_10825 [Flavihumibacter solisilvae]
MNILMVEDNPGDQVLLRELIRSSGITYNHIYAAGTIREAVQLLEKHQVDILLLDLSLPDGYGIGSFKTIRDQAPGIPVVILSGVADTRMALEAITLGAQDFLLKGDFDGKLLAKTIFYSIERMHSMQALQESIQRYNLVSRATNDMVWDWNIETGTVYRNREGWKKILKSEAPQSEVGTESDWDSRVHPEDVERVSKAIHALRISQDAENFEFEFRVRRDDGSYAFILDRGHIIRDENGTAIRMIGASQDITEKKLTELNLRNSEMRFRSLIENSWDGLAIVDSTGIIRDFSPSGTRILGYRRQDAIGMNAYDLVHPVHRERMIFVMKQIVAEKESAQYVEQLMRKADGTYGWVEATLHNQLHEPAVGGIVVNYRDINERKNAEQNLRQSEERFRYLFDNNPASIIIWDPQTFRVLEVNDATIRQSGYTREELLSSTIMNRIAEKPEHIRELAERVLADPNFRQTRITRLFNKNGEKMFIEFASHRIEYEGKPTILALGNNVTERIKLEKQLESERVEKQQEITDAVISAQENERQEIGRELHDNINQILASSRLYLGLALNEVGMSGPHLKKTDKLINAAIDEIRSLSHSLIPPPLHDSELSDALDHIIETTSRITEISISHNLENFCEQGLPDKLKLTIYRIVQEQFTNVQKHARATEIDLSLTRDESQVELSIRDNGAGFDSTKKQPGVGLLNIKTRASLFNGTVDIHTSPGAGCNLIVTFSMEE